MFTSIVWATDGSDPADRALDYATQLALGEGASVHAVHVVEKLVGTRVPGQDVFLGESEIDEKIKRQSAVLNEGGVPTTLHMGAAASTHVAEQISEIADSIGADLIVIGTRGHSAFVGAVIGSVTQRLLHLTQCPVLAVPPSWTVAVPGDAASAPKP